MTTLLLPAHVRAARDQEIHAAEIVAHADDTVRVFAGFSEQGPAPEPTWQEELGRIAPRDGFHSWLKLTWYPGYPWAPAARWVVCQMIEAHAIDPLLASQLTGPDPRSLGYWSHETHRWVTSLSITRYQWDLYRETGCLAQPFWIVQGDRGGHKARWTHVESNVSAMNGGPRQPPDVGALPFAPFDSRVVRALERLREAELWAQSVAYAKKRWDILDSHERQEAQEMRAKLWDWLSEQIAEPADRLAHALSKDWTTADVPTLRNTSVAAEVERAREDFIITD